MIAAISIKDAARFSTMLGKVTGGVSNGGGGDGGGGDGGGGVDGGGGGGAVQDFTSDIGRAQYDHEEA
jgi:hypothetical protein